MNRKVYAWSLVLALALALLMGGCAAMRQDEAQKTDDLLAAAGFKARPADTPEKLAHLKAMQPLKVSMRTKDGRGLSTAMPIPITANVSMSVGLKSSRSTNALP